MVIRSNFIGRTFRKHAQGLCSRSNRIISFKLVCPALLLLSFALIRQSIHFTPPSLLQRSQSPPKFKTCANFSDPLKVEHDMLMMNISRKHNNDAQDHQIFLSGLSEHERYMWYAPHDGFDKQILQLVNALKIAMLLNRTLIIPPIFEEGEVVVGDCLQSQVTPQTLRQLAWSAVAERIADSRYLYVSIADIIDVRSVSPKWVRTIDMRVFLALWCGIDVSQACSPEGEICHSLTSSISPWETLESCRARFLPTKRSCLAREVEESCRNTVWTNSENRASRDFWEQILEKKVLEQYELVPESRSSNSRTEVQSDEHYIKRKSVVEYLGPGTGAEHYSVLSFGSLLPQPFRKLSLLADIRPIPGNDPMEQAFEAIEALPYTEEIMHGARNILDLLQLSKRAFFCGHLDLGNVRHGREVGGGGEEEMEMEAEITLTRFRSRLEKLVEQERSREGGRVNVFVMTDLLSEIWSEKYLGDIADNRTFYEIYAIDGYQDTLLDTAHKTMTHEYGLKSGYIPPHRTAAAARSVAMDDVQHSLAQANWESGSGKVELPPDIRDSIEEVICSCATLGFYGTFPSAVSTRILNLRRAKLCPVLTIPQVVVTAAG